jgi:hypothetical protein
MTQLFWQIEQRNGEEEAAGHWLGFRKRIFL